LICAIILAAGESRRMGELKPLIKINAKTFLQHIAGQIRKAEIEKIAVIAGYIPAFHHFLNSGAMGIYRFLSDIFSVSVLIGMSYFLIPLVLILLLLFWVWSSAVSWL